VVVVVGGTVVVVGGTVVVVAGGAVVVGDAGRVEVVAGAEVVGDFGMRLRIPAPVVEEEALGLPEPQALSNSAVAPTPRGQTDHLSTLSLRILRFTV